MLIAKSLKAQSLPWIQSDPETLHVQISQSRAVTQTQEKHGENIPYTFLRDSYAYQQIKGLVNL